MSDAPRPGPQPLSPSGPPPGALSAAALDVARFEAVAGETQRLQFSVRDAVVLVVACGLYFGLLRLVRNPALEILGDRLALATSCFWPLPIALLGLFARPVAPSRAAPLVSGQLLWRVCALAYPLACLLVGMAAGVVWQGSASQLTLGMLAIVTAWLLVLGGLLLAECGAGGDAFPATHWVGIWLYLYLLLAVPAALALVWLR